jgi:type VI secretion system protein ImpL
MLRSIARFLFNRFTLVLCGLVLLSLVIWFIGPLVYIQRYQPLGSVSVRVAVIAALFGLWLLRLLLLWWRAKQMNARLLQQLARFGAPRKAATPTQGEEEVAALEKSFQEAVSVLAKTRFGQADQGWMGRWTRRYVYQLPWYLIIGSPGSGKTTALVNSGLDFPLEARFGKSAVRGVGGTRNCDWWFTDQAVLLDTAGRYTTQESDAAQDKVAWSGFLNLLKRFRGRQPVNGVLVTLSVQELLDSDEAERARLAQLIGMRLAELCEQLAIKFPVYVLVTKTDLLAGFNEFFGNMNREERAQVWGFTLPYGAGAQVADVGVQFQTEFDALVAQINRLLPQRLSTEPDLARRGPQYSLPQQFGGLRDVLSQTVSAIFSSSRFAEKPLLRGVYFTSGTQEGMPFDRVLSVLARRFAVAPPARAALAGQSGKSYFIENLFKEVVFPEAGLTGRNAKKERQLRVWQAAGLLGLAGILVAACIGWSISHGNNVAYLDEVGQRVAGLEQAVTQIAPVRGDDAYSLVPVLDEARALARSERYEGESAPLSWRLGLLQVPKMEAAADATYLRLLEDAWWPALVRQVHRSLQTSSAASPEGSYEALKIYLMLYQPEHFDAGQVKAWLRHQWETGMPATARQGNLPERMAEHLDRLLDDRLLTASVPMDQALVADVRQRLAQMSPAQRAYSRLKLQLQSDNGLPPDFTLVRAAGPEAPQLFQRRSGQPLTQGISGLFTYDGYHGAVSHALPKVTTLLAREEGWVLGATERRSEAKELLSGQLANEVKRLYLMEYAKRWEDFLADVQPLRPATLEQAGEQARLYSAANSGVEQFFRAVAQETTLTRRPEPSTGSWLGDKLNRIKEEQAQLSRLTGKQVNVAGLVQSGTLEADIVDHRFREYRRLTTGSGSGPSPLTSSLQVANEAAAVIASARQQVKVGGSVPPSLPTTLERLRGEAKRVPPPLNTMYEQLAAATSSFVGSDLRQQLGGNLAASVGDFCRKALLGRYPFTRSAARDVTSDDFSRLFASGGTLDEFFRTQLQPLVDVSTTPWTFKQGVDGTPVGGSAALASFQRAATIRDVYFRSGGKVPSIRLEVKPLDMDAAITQMVLDVDGEVLRYQHGPQIPKTLNWPGSRGTGQVRLQITSSDGQNNGLVVEGPWALHRLFDRAQLVPGQAPERFTAAFHIGGHRLRMEVTAGSVHNPFRLRAMEEFECPNKL